MIPITLLYCEWLYDLNSQVWFALICWIKYVEEICVKHCKSKNIFELLSPVPLLHLQTGRERPTWLVRIGSDKHYQPTNHIPIYSRNTEKNYNISPHPTDPTLYISLVLSFCIFLFLYFSLLICLLLSVFLFVNYFTLLDSSSLFFLPKKSYWKKKLRIPL